MNGTSSCASSTTLLVRGGNYRLDPHGLTDIYSITISNDDIRIIIYNYFFSSVEISYFGIRKRSPTFIPSCFLL